MISKFTIFVRDNFQCIYCGKSARLDGVRITVDHVTPVSAGGDDRAINVVCCCRGCNYAKGDRLLPEAVERDIRRVLHQRNQEQGIRNAEKVDLSSSAASLRPTQQPKEGQSWMDYLDEAKSLGDGRIYGRRWIQMVRFAMDGTEELFEDTENWPEMERKLALLARCMAVMEHALNSPEELVPRYTEELFDTMPYFVMPDEEP